MRDERVGLADRNRHGFLLRRFLLILALALVVRVLLLWQIRASPFFDHPVGDGRAYHEWAGQIAAGHWLGDTVFYQAPLYPYFLGLLRALGMRGFWGLYLVQSVLGAAACGFIFLAGGMFFGQKDQAKESSSGAGEAAGLLLAVYAPAVFFDGVLQKASLDFFLMSLLLFALGWNLSSPRLAKWLGVGALLGLLALTRENALVLAPVVLAWLLVYFRDRRMRARLAWVGAFAAGMALVLMPVALRNYAVGGDFALTTSQMGPNFYIGNNPDADGTYESLRPRRGDPRFERTDATELAEKALGRRLSPSEVSRYWMGRSLTYIRRQPADWLALMGRKWFLFWNAYEVPDQEDYYIYREYSGLLAVLAKVFHFGLLCPLAFAGLVLTWRQRRRLWLLYALLLAFAASVAAFYIFARYRFAAVPILALFAGAAAAQAFEAIRGRLYRGLAPAAIALVVAAVLVNWPSPVGDPARPSRYVLAFVLAERGDLEGAEENYRRELERDPQHADAHYNLANLLRQKATAPRVPSWVAQRYLWEAAAHYRAAIQARSEWAAPHVNLGIVCGMLRDYAAAEPCFRRAIEIDPADGIAWRNLAECLRRARRYRDAADALREAVHVCPDDRAARADLAWLLATAPDPKARDGPAALILAQALVAEAPDGDPRALDIWAAALAENGKFKEAAAAANDAAERAARSSAGAKLAGGIRQRARLYESGEAYRSQPENEGP